MYVFVKFVRSGLIEHNGVVGLVLDCSEVKTSAKTSEKITGDSSRIESAGYRVGWRRQCPGDGGGESIVPLPFDHFFFCFLPAEAAAGAYCTNISMFGESVIGANSLTMVVDGQAQLIDVVQDGVRGLVWG